MIGMFIELYNIVEDVLILKLTTNPYQPRTSINSLQLNDLASSIKEERLLQPILISPIKNRS